MKEFIITGLDNYDIHGRVSIPDNSCGQILCIVHGMCEHIDRYNNFIKYLSSKGYHTLIYDLRGHGKYVDKSMLGYLNNEDLLIKDLDAVINYIKKCYPNLVVTLLGHSMGSLIVRNYLQKYDNKIDKVILLGPPTYNPMVAIGKLIVNSDILLWGDIQRSKFINNLVFGSYNKGYDTLNEWLTTDINVINDYNRDERCGFIFTLNGFKVLFSLLKNAYISGKYKCLNNKLPILLLGGMDDPVIGGEKKFNHLYNFLSQVGYSNIQKELYEGMRHEVLNDVNKNKVYQRIIKFMNR